MCLAASVSHAQEAPLPDDQNQPLRDRQSLQDEFQDPKPPTNDTRPSSFPKAPRTATPLVSPDKPSLSDEQTKNAKRAIEMLASREFAARERGGETLLGLGEAVVPLLREYVKVSSNAEATLRAKTLIKQMNDGDLEDRLEAFVRGENVGFEGWPIFRIMFGDNGRARDLFVELMRSYPELIESFHGTPRDRAKAMESITKTIDAKRKNLSARLSVADAIAMLLPVSDQAVPINEGYERGMLMVLRMSPATNAPSDPVIGRAFTGLLNAWVRRSTIENRDEVLDYAIRLALNTTLPLALQTLKESQQPRVLGTAMQAIARFGKPEMASEIIPFLDDDRELLLTLHTRRTQSRVRICDVAMATIAKMYDVPLEALGYPDRAEHSVFGFLYEDLIFVEEAENPVPIKQQRDNARAKVDQLIKEGKLTETEKS